MYLKRLEMQGFKSFADKTVLEFMPGITTVIGPNGSGKSNISDSIRWVLGEQSIKSLRGTKSEDIIFAGTQNRKSLGFAEASIVIDNTDGKLPIEFAEVVVTRRIFRNGESGYFINKAPCRLKDIQELFMDTGIGKDGYSIIGQGKIDDILSNKSEDRRNIFEEAAGIVKYRARKTESEKKLEQTKLNLLRINDILAEIEANIGPLKNQAEKAKKYLSLREELKSIEIGLFIYNIDTYKVKIEELVIDIINSQKEDEESRLSVLQNLKENLKTELEEIISKIEETQNLGFESEKKIEQINSDINVQKTKIENNNQNSNTYLKEIEELKKRNAEILEEKENRINKKDNLLANREKFVLELEEKENKLQELTSKLSKEEVEIEEKKKQVEKNTEAKYENREAINTLEVNNENLNKRSKTVKNEIQETISKLDEKRMLKSDLLKTFNEKESKRNECQKRLEDIKVKREEANAKITEFDNKINNLTQEYRIKDSKQKFLQEMEKEKEGYSRAVKSVLTQCEVDSNLNKGVRGVLASLITVPEEYQLAVETVLGQTLQNIVTETEEDAKKLIEYLRKNNLGRASFLPITSVKGKNLDKLITNGTQGVIGVASKLIKTDKKYEEIISNLLGKTVIVNDMDTAIVIAKQNKYSFRIVTLKGDIINPSGAISGGSTTQKTNSIIGRTAQIKQLEKEIEKIQKEIEKITKEKEDYENSIESLLEEITSIEASSRETEIEYATEEQRLESIEETISSLETKLDKLKTETNEIVESIDKNKEEKAVIEQKNLELEQEITILNTAIQNFAEKNKENQKYIDDLNFDITNLKISVSSFDESSNSLEEILSRIENELQTNMSKIENKKQQSKNLKVENEELTKTIEELKQNIEQIKIEVSTSSETAQKLKQEKSNKNMAITKAETEIEEKYKIIEEIKNQANKLEVKKSKLDVELEQIINKMWEDYEITPNTAGEFKKPNNVAETTKEVKHLRDEIKNLGSINIDSIEEYKQTKERYDYMCEQRLDLENASSKLKKVIQDMTKIMKEQFEKQFNIINKNFGEVFKELFGGGKAELKLTDETDILNCGIEIEVQPPGKKLQNMMLLSGGERAFTAIALLFSILRINPAPFCVLDEIEAALDDVNVYKFADYLKKFTGETQFLVITHRKGTMEAADTVYGITMEESGISKLLSMKLEKK